MSDTTPIHNRYFYLITAIVLFACMFLGFSNFYLQGKAVGGRDLTLPIKTLLILHGISMTAWVLLFLIQPILIIKAKHKLHKTLGKIGAFTAITMVILGLKVAIESARVNPPDLLLWNLNPTEFMAIPFFSIILFGILVALAIWKRKTPNIHRAMMLLATMIIITAATDRIGAFRSIYAETMLGMIFGPFGAMFIIGTIFLILHSALTRSLNRPYAIGLIACLLAGALIMRIAPTPFWTNIARSLLN